MKTLLPLLALLLCPLIAAAADAPKTDAVVPEGYVLQALEPTGGKIAKPKNWFYARHDDPTGFSWIIAKEDPTRGNYDTGFRIQFVTEVKKTTRMTAEKFMLQARDANKKNALKVVSECPQAQQGAFTRICLETQETIHSEKYHILYSYFWSNKSDIAVVTTFGTPLDEWDADADIRRITAGFELVNTKNAAPPQPVK